MTKAEGVLIADGRSSIFLHPPIAASDRHRYHHLVELVAGPFQGTIDAECYSNNLSQFQNELIGLYRSLKGMAPLDTYENLALSLEGDGMGHVQVRVDARPRDIMKIRLSFEFDIDQTQLRDIIIERFV